MEEQSEKKHKAVFAIVDKGPGRKPYWMKIGIAFLNSDSSWNIYLDAMPFDRKLQIREEDGKYSRSQSERSATPSFDVGGIQ